MSAISKMLLDLDRPTDWPVKLLTCLNEYHGLFLEWETRPSSFIAQAYDKAIDALIDTLQPYQITGWHCTRLTDTEAKDILKNGMQLPDATMLECRIDALVEDNLITPDIARRLKSKNQADEENRAGIVWFCFFPLRIESESGIGRFFRHWGGEALYNSHEEDQITSPVLSRIGTPCLVEADVPISSLKRGEGLAFKIVRRFLISRGYHTTEPIEYEGYINHPLPAKNIKRIIHFPDPDFCSLTGCSEWHRPLTQS